MKRAIIDNLPLPEDLVRDIFLRLSVKILSRCKVVCKQWCALIESPSFVNQHFCQERNQERLLLCVQDPELGELLDLYIDGYRYALSVDETFSEFEEPCHLQMPDAFGEFIGPLNGVFCVVSHSWPKGPSALFNPATRQFKPLPFVEQVLPDRRGHFGKHLGIGLDPSTGDYKLVLIMYRTISPSRGYVFDYECLVCVCTSDSDSWRLIDNVDSNVPSRRHVHDSICNIYLKGVYYWWLKFEPRATSSDVVILAFDMRTEKFKEMQVMGSVSVDQYFTTGVLGIRGDSLVLLMRYNVDGCTDVWTMLDDSSWIKSSSLGPLEGIGYPLCFWKNNSELLLEAVEELHSFLKSYNVSTQEVRDLKVSRSDGGRLCHWVLVYKESLVSLKGKSGKCEVWDTGSDFIQDFFTTSMETILQRDDPGSSGISGLELLCHVLEGMNELN